MSSLEDDDDVCVKYYLVGGEISEYACHYG